MPLAHTCLTCQICAQTFLSVKKKIKIHSFEAERFPLTELWIIAVYIDIVTTEISRDEQNNQIDGCWRVGFLPVKKLFLLAKKLFLPGQWQETFSRDFAGAVFTTFFLTDFNHHVPKNQHVIVEKRGRCEDIPTGSSHISAPR